MAVLNPNYVFLKEQLPNIRVAALQGSTRSGKTYSTLQYLIWLCTHHSGIKVSICRATFPALKATVMRDFFEILESVGLYSEANHNKTDHIYFLNGCEFDFFALDDHKKVMGRKRDLLYVNEALECDYNVFRQLALRTSGRIIIDFNPFEAEHWVYDEVQTRVDCKTLITTYKDNPHLSKAQIEEIELLKDTDPDYWKVFGEGQRSSGGTNIIYKNWQLIPNYNEIDTKHLVYGLDFGFSTSKMAMVEIKFDGYDAYITEKYYENGSTIGDLLPHLHEKVQKNKHIEADSARPESVEEISRAGFNIHPCKKFAGSLKAGIDTVKRYRLFVDENSLNLVREFRYYKWQTNKDGKPTDEPLQVMDHLMDAVRYAIEHHHRTYMVNAPKVQSRHPIEKKKEKWI